jgi:hypothetical protein
LLNLRRGCFGGSAASGILPLTSSTPCRRIRRRCCIRDQFVRPLMTPIDCNHHSKAAGKKVNRRLCLSAPDDASAAAGRLVRAVEPERKTTVRPRDHTPARSRCLPTSG